MDDDNLLKMAQFISELRKSKNLTQKELAEQLGVTDKAVSKWERGLNCPDISLLSNLSHILGVTIQELLSGERTKPSITEEESRSGALPQHPDKIKNNSDGKKPIVKFLARVLLVSLLCIVVFIASNHAIELGLGWVVLPIHLTSFVWLAAILIAFIIGKNKISSALLCSYLIFMATFYYSAMNEAREGVLIPVNGFPKNYIPHYTVILVAFILSVVLALITMIDKKGSSDKTFFSATIMMTILLISMLTIPAIMDYVDSHSLGVDGRFTLLILLTILIDSLSLALLARRRITQIAPPRKLSNSQS